jgi:hypothetical protein
MKIKTLGSGSSGDLHFGNGSSIVSPAFPLLDVGKFAWISDFAINRPNVKIDPAIKMIIEKESERLRYKTFKYSSGNEKDWQLDSILESSDGAKDNAKAKLTQDGKSAVIADVSKSINASNVDHSSKYLLSNEPLYVYALSYAIYSEKVNDKEGINDRVIVATENKIKPHFNKVVAESVIRDKHLDLTEAQKNKILEAAATTNISYLKGEPLKAINKIISKFVDYGDLHALVDRFFASGEIDSAKGTPQVRQLMVNYLIEIGLTLPSDDSDDDDRPAGGSSSENSPKGSKTNK